MLKKFMSRFKIMWPPFSARIGMEAALDVTADKVIKRVSTACSLGGEENLRENVKKDLEQLFLQGGERRIVKIHRRIRELETDIRQGRI